VAEAFEGLCGAAPVAGNAAPVLIGKRVLLPHVHNNFRAHLTYSDDGGRTWAAPEEIPGAARVAPAGPDCARNMSYFGLGADESWAEWLEGVVAGARVDECLDAARRFGCFVFEGHTSTRASRRPAALSKRLDARRGVFPTQAGSGDPYHDWADKLAGPWQFVGLGPPGSLLHSSGRIVVPGYHSFIRGGTGGGRGAGIGLPVAQLYNNLALAHFLLSDDGGVSWRLVDPAFPANEMQLAELRNGSVLANSRSLSTGSRQARLMARSDDAGETWTPSRSVRISRFGSFEGRDAFFRPRLDARRGSDIHSGRALSRSFPSPSTAARAPLPPAATSTSRTQIPRTTMRRCPKRCTRWAAR